MVKKYYRCKGKKKVKVRGYRRRKKKRKAPQLSAESIQKILKNPKTPKHLKPYWEKRLRQCPGGKIRSKGKGRGLGTGKGKGPLNKRRRSRNWYVRKIGEAEKAGKIRRRGGELSYGLKYTPY